MSSASVLLQARGLGRQIPGDGQWLFRDLDLHIDPGERLAIVGPTGSGKTLLMRGLAALDACDAGEILWQGKPVTDAAIPQFRRQAVYLHQRAALFEGSVETNLKMVFSLHAHREQQYDRDRVLAWLDELGRGEKFLQQPAVDLSGGEAQITALIRAMQCDPLLLMLDEATSALDPDTTAAAEAMIRHWQEADKRRALIWVSHDPRQIERIATRKFSLNHQPSSE